MPGGNPVVRINAADIAFVTLMMTALLVNLVAMTTSALQHVYRRVLVMITVHHINIVVLMENVPQIVLEKSVLLVVIALRLSLVVAHLIEDVCAIVLENRVPQVGVVQQDNVVMKRIRFVKQMAVPHMTNLIVG